MAYMEFGTVNKTRSVRQALYFHGLGRQEQNLDLDFSAFLETKVGPARTRRQKYSVRQWEDFLKSQITKARV